MSMRRISLIAIAISAFVATTTAVWKFSPVLTARMSSAKKVTTEKPQYEGSARIQDLGKMIHRSIVMDQQDFKRVGDQIRNLEAHIARMHSEIENLHGVQGGIQTRLKKLNVLRTVVEEKVERKVPTPKASTQEKKQESDISKVEKLLGEYTTARLEKKKQNFRIRIAGDQFFQSKSGTKIIAKERFSALRKAVTELSKDHAVEKILLQPRKGVKVSELLELSNVVKEELGHTATLLPEARNAKESIRLEILARASR